MPSVAPTRPSAPAVVAVRVRRSGWWLLWRSAWAQVAPSLATYESDGESEDPQGDECSHSSGSGAEGVQVGLVVTGLDSHAGGGRQLPGPRELVFGYGCAGLDQPGGLGSSPASPAEGRGCDE